MSSQQDLQATCGSGMALPQQKLPFDIFYKVARDFLVEAKDVLALAMTSHEHWEYIHREIYRADILLAKSMVEQGVYRRSWAGPGTAEAWADLYLKYDPLDANRVCYSLDGLPRRPFRGLVPDNYAPQNPRHPTILHRVTLDGNLPALNMCLTVSRDVWPDYVSLLSVDYLHGALHLATAFGKAEILRAILDHDSTTVNETLPDCLSTLSLVFEYEQQLHLRGYSRMPIPIQYLCDNKPRNALCFALARKQQECAKILAEYHDETHHDWARTLHPLDIAAFSGMINIAETLIQKGADVRGRTLRYALRREGNDAMVDFLLEKGGIATRAHLDEAIRWRAPGNTKKLLERGVGFDFLPPYTDHKEECNFGECQFQQCLSHDVFIDCTKLMLTMPSNLDERSLNICLLHALRDIDGNEQTLKYFIENGCPMDILTLLLEKRPEDINRLDCKGSTAASVAFCHKNFDRQKAALFFQYGAEPSACSTPQERVILEEIRRGTSAEDINQILELQFDGIWPDSDYSARYWYVV
ncbi:hypothetical protein F4808DRAFT_470885 [Astrocystis sublimbata]|nr:hypothetical protein F4808DRAFT_470885 [Astrocystis sublimbata]